MRGGRLRKGGGFQTDFEAGDFRGDGEVDHPFPEPGRLLCLRGCKEREREPPEFLLRRNDAAAEAEPFLGPLEEVESFGGAARHTFVAGDRRYRGLGKERRPDRHSSGVGAEPEHSARSAAAGGMSERVDPGIRDQRFRESPEGCARFAPREAREFEGGLVDRAAEYEFLFRRVSEREFFDVRHF